MTNVVYDNESLIREYLEWKKTHSPIAADRYRVWVKRFQDFANRAPEALSIQDWVAFAESLKDRFAPKSVEFALIIVQDYLRFWKEQGRLRGLPLYFVRVPRAKSVPHNAIEEQEYQQMVTVLQSLGPAGLRDLVIVMLLHDTGMRVGELASLEIDQIEETHRQPFDPRKPRAVAVCFGTAIQTMSCINWSSSASILVTIPIGFLWAGRVMAKST